MPRTSQGLCRDITGRVLDEFRRISVCRIRRCGLRRCGRRQTVQGVGPMTTGGEIAIVGMSGRFPGARSVPEFWANLQAGRESIVPPDGETAAAEHDAHATAHWVKVNSLLKDVDLFDASFFGFSPREAEMIDPQQRIFLECAWEALEDAGYRAGDVLRHVGVFAGSALSAYIFDQFPDGA